MKLLMIEDNKSVSEMMSMFFQKEGWDVSFAYDGMKPSICSMRILTVGISLPWI